MLDETHSDEDMRKDDPPKQDCQGNSTDWASD